MLTWIHVAAAYLLGVLTPIVFIELVRRSLTRSLLRDMGREALEREFHKFAREEIDDAEQGP